MLITPPLPPRRHIRHTPLPLPRLSLRLRRRHAARCRCFRYADYATMFEITPAFLLLYFDGSRRFSRHAAADISLITSRRFR